MVSDWTSRIAAGEVPDAPPRPTGVERNVVLTMWNWGDNVAFVHDEVTTDKRNPRVNANGPIYGVDIGNDNLLVTDPNEHHSTMLKIPLRAERSTVPSMFTTEGFRPWRDFGERAVWDDPANPHNPMLDSTGRVWLTTRVRAPDNPAWCREGSDNPYAQYFPLERSGRHTGYFDPEAQTFVLIDTCFGTHHLQFAEDENDTLYFSGGGQVIGWLNTKLYDETGDERRAQGWCPTVLDTNGDCVITKPWNEPPARGSDADASHDPTLDTRVVVGAYGIIANPVDDSIWVASDRYPESCCDSTPGATHPRPVSASSTPSRRSAAIEPAGSTSTAVASSGRRWLAAVTLAALTGRSARSSMVPPCEMDASATTGGRFIGCRVRRMPGPTSGPTSTITTGSTSSTHWVSVKTSRSPTAQTPIRCWP